jgi:hypothetical protein
MQGFAQDCWSAYIFFNQIHYFMVKINTFFAEWRSGLTSAVWQGQNTARTNQPNQTWRKILAR